jgi:flagellar basal body-associated protein FliL
MDWQIVTFTAFDLLAWIGLGFVIVMLSIATAAIVVWITDHTEGRR